MDRTYAKGAAAESANGAPVDHLARAIDITATSYQAIDQAIRGAVVRVLLRRAEGLRARAASLITTISDGRGRMVKISTPEAEVMFGTAEFFENCAVDVGGAA